MTDNELPNGLRYSHIAQRGPLSTLPPGRCSVLVADDSLVARQLVQGLLRRWGYAVTTASDGAAAVAIVTGPDAPSLAILDWEMPGLTGPEVCRRARTAGARTYLLLLTSKNAKSDVIEGLRAGADDYLTKPFDEGELRARVQVGERIIGLEAGLAARVADLEAALAQVQQLQGLVPICAYCKRIRDDGNYWHQLEQFIEQHSGAQFSHSICPSCYEAVIQPQLGG